MNREDQKRELLLPSKPVPHVQAQVLVLLKGQPTPVFINPEDTILRGTEPIKFPEGVMAQLTHPKGWVDVWHSQKQDDGTISRLGVRLFGRNVTMLTQAYIFPKEEEQVQA